MDSEKMISTMDTLILLDCLSVHGVEHDVIFRETGVDSSIVDNIDFEIPLDGLIKLWRLAVNVTGDKALGIHLRGKYGNRHIHFVNYIAMNSKNLGEALTQYTRYGKLFGKPFSYQVRTEEKETVFSVDVNSNTQNPGRIIEYQLSLPIYFASALGVEKTKIKEVRFQHSCFESISTYSRFFDASVLFDQQENALIFQSSDLDIEIPDYNPHLQSVLKKQAETALGSLAKMDSFSTEVEKVIMKNLGSGQLDVQLVAKILNMHRSTLHRKLKEHGTSFNALVTDIRRHLSQVYLRQGMSIDQIAFLLGYSNRSSFQYAFKSWFSQTPGAFRRSVNA